MIVMIVGYVLLALLVVTVVIGISSVYLEHKRLLSLADGASLAAADSYTLGEVAGAAEAPRPSSVPSGSERGRRTSWPEPGVGPVRRAGRDAGNRQPRRFHRRRGAQLGGPPACGELPGAGRDPDRSSIHGPFPAHALTGGAADRTRRSAGAAPAADSVGLNNHGQY